MVKVIVFDWDGTLFNSDTMVENIYRDLVSFFPAKLTLESLKSSLYSKSYLDNIKELYDEDASLYLDFIMHRVQHYLSQTKLFDNVFDVLMDFKKHQIQLGLLTSELKNILECELLHTGLLQVFDYILTFNDLEKPKPDSEGMVKMMDFFSVKPYEIMMIGDQESDHLCANTLFIETIYMNHHKQKNHMFDHSVYDMLDLKKYILHKNQMCLKMTKDHFKILQLTDLHLMGHQNDEKTYRLIDQMIKKHQPDFIVSTGDQVMSKDSLNLYQMWINQMDTYKTPYSFVFGNHDHECIDSYHELFDSIFLSHHIKFSLNKETLGYSNFYIEIINQENNVENLLIFLDSHQDDFYLMDQEKIWGYGTINASQIAWLKTLIQRYHSVCHLVFLHIPPFEVSEVKVHNTSYQGRYDETPSTPPINTQWIDVINQHHQTLGVFFGHDHYNDFSFIRNHVLFAYGVTSGYYEYGLTHPKGARMIVLDGMGHIKSYQVYEKDE